MIVPAGGKAGPDRGALAGHGLLFAALYGGYGALSPFLPSFLEARGLTAPQIANLLAAATLVRIVSGPLSGRLADRLAAVRAVLVAALALSGLLAFAHLAASSPWSLAAIGLAYAVVTAPLAPLSDALALAASENGRRFVYGRVRGAGSAAFVLATGAVGWLVPGQGLAVALLTGGALFLGAGAAALALPPSLPSRIADPALWQGFSLVVAAARFRRVVLAAALVIGAHAMHDAFAMILWSRAGITPGLAGLLWSEAVAAEIAVFLLLGPWLLSRIGPARAIALAAAAGTLRWGVMAETAALPALVAIQLLHGLTFALLHLACLQEIGRAVPPHLTATALTLYGTFGLGLASAVFLLASGALFGALGAAGFWAMAGVSLAAVPLALSLRTDEGR